MTDADPRPQSVVVRPRDMPHLREICRAYLFETQWAGWLGQPMPKTHESARAKRDVREIRHRRAFAYFIVRCST